MKKLREAVLSKGVTAETIDQNSTKTVLSEDVLASLDNVGGADGGHATRPGLFGRVFGRIPF
jgi:hypothetical protein